MPYYDPWYGWVSTALLTNMTVGTTATQVWNNWNQISPPTGASYYPVAANTVWANWQTINTYVPSYTIPEPTPEEQERIKRIRLIQVNRHRAAAVRRRVAERKAEELLLSNLDRTQREEYSKDRSFTVYTAEGKRAYKIRYGIAGNIHVVKAEGEPPIGKRGHLILPGTRLCYHAYHPDGEHLPPGDHMLAQKLMLECAEDQVLAMANAS